MSVGPPGVTVGVGVGVGVSVGAGVGVAVGSHESGDSVGEENVPEVESTSINAILVGLVAPVEIYSDELDNVPDVVTLDGVVQSLTLYL